MPHEVYKYCFDPQVSIQEVDETLMLAVLAVEGLHGRSNVRLNATFRLEKKARKCVVDADSEVGRDLARIFTGYLSREFGEGAFRVERATGEMTQAAGSPAVEGPP